MTKPVTGTKPPPPGMIVHGNEYHEPDFEEEGVAASLVGDHEAAADPHTGYIRHSLATAVGDFLVASGAGAFVKQTLAQVRTLLNWAADIAAHSALATGVHGVGASTVDSVAARIAAIVAHAALPDVHHAEDHAAEHEPGGGDPMAVDAVPATGSLRTLGAGAQQAMPGDAAPPAGPHAASHEPGGADTMAVDAAAGTGSLRTLGGGAVQAAPGNHTHTLQDDVNGTDDSGEGTGVSSTRYRYGRTVNDGTEDSLFVANKTLNFAAGSRTVAVGSCVIRASNSALVLRLYMGGVLVATSSGFSTSFADARIITGARALVGSQECKAVVANPSGSNHEAYVLNWASGAKCDRTVLIGIRSVKL